tara:strand:- start:90 stop:725 length:636 start_codon:yes stop_codon:yes gene_type:complete
MQKNLSVDSPNSIFAEHGFEVIRDFVSSDILSLFAYYVQMMGGEDWEHDTGKVIGGEEGAWANRYGDWFSEALMLKNQPQVEAITGLSLLPTYSYLRIYGSNSVLPLHTDRDSCEVSVSMTVDYDSDHIWPLWSNSLSGQLGSFILDRGDALVYRGNRLPHMRNEFTTGKYWVQSFAHYVDANGSFADHKFDRRDKLGDPSVNSREITIEL